MNRQDPQLRSVPPDEAYSLESILAEYGKGGRQPVQMEVSAAPEPTAADVPEPAQPVRAEPPREQEVLTTRLPRPKKSAEKKKPGRIPLSFR